MKYRQIKDIHPDEIMGAMLKHDGVILHAALDLGVDRSALSRYINKDEDLKALKSDTRERMLDKTEGKLFDAINDPTSKNHITAVIFFLKCQGKPRGYVERQEVSHSGDLGQIVAPVRAQTPEEWAKQNEAAG